MNESSEEESQTAALPDHAQKPMQFSVSTLLTLTVVISALAGYLRPHGIYGVGLVAVTTPIAVLIGFALGKLKGDLWMRIYWAVVAATIVQIITANVYMLRPWDYFVWPIFAALIAGWVSCPKEYNENIRRFFAYNSVTRMAIGGALEPRLI